MIVGTKEDHAYSWRSLARWPEKCQGGVAAAAKRANDSLEWPALVVSAVVLWWAATTQGII
jgi:hypothetical protein